MATSVPARPRWSLPIMLLVMVFAAFEITYLTMHLRLSLDGTSLPFGDFFGSWAHAHFIRDLPAAQIYDPVALGSFELKLPGGVQEFYPYLYPPLTLLYIWPLGWFDYLPAAGLWLVSTLVAYLVAVAGRDWRSPRLWLALTAPTTVLTIIAGQNGFLTAALLIGGFRLMGRRPILGGFILGGLAYKPQFLLLVPIVLLASRQWRGLFGLALSVSALCGAATIAFGPVMWLRWFQSAAKLSHFFELNWPHIKHLEPTVTEAALSVGLDIGAAQAVQIVATLGVAFCLWRMLGRGAPGAAPRPLDIAALQVAAFLATPYAFIYDMPMVTSAVATTIEQGMQSGRPWRRGEATVLAAALILPITLFSGIFDGWALGPVVLALLLALIIRIGRSMPGHPPERT